MHGRVTDLSLLSEALSEVAAAELRDAESRPSTDSSPASFVGTSASAGASANVLEAGARAQAARAQATAGAQEGARARQESVQDDSQEADDSTEPPAADATPDADWTVSFEQFVASVLTEPLLVSFFEKRGDVRAAVAQLRSVRLNRQTSLSFSLPSGEAAAVL